MKDDKGFIVATTDAEALEAADQLRRKVVGKADKLKPIMGKIIVHKIFTKEKAKHGEIEIVQAATPKIDRPPASINLYETSPFQAVVCQVGEPFDMGPMNQEKMILEKGDHIICKNELSDDLKRGAFMYNGMMFSIINQTDVICIVPPMEGPAPASGVTTEVK